MAWCLHVRQSCWFLGWLIDLHGTAAGGWWEVVGVRARWQGVGRASLIHAAHVRDGLRGRAAAAGGLVGRGRPVDRDPRHQRKLVAVRVREPDPGGDHGGDPDAVTDVGADDRTDICADGCGADRGVQHGRRHGHDQLHSGGKESRAVRGMHAGPPSLGCDGRTVPGRPACWVLPPTSVFGCLSRVGVRLVPLLLCPAAWFNSPGNRRRRRRTRP